MSDDYLRFNEREDFISSLEHAATIVQGDTLRHGDWKWLILSIHSGWQGAMVATLSGSVGIGALNSRSQADVARWIEDTRVNPSAPAPQEWLADPLELFRRCMNASFMGEFGGSPLNVQGAVVADLTQLNELRRRFTHFRPSSWSVELAGLPRILLSAVQVVAVLVAHPAIQLRINSAERCRMEKAIDRLRQSLNTG